MGRLRRKNRGQRKFGVACSRQLDSRTGGSRPGKFLYRLLRLLEGRSHRTRIAWARKHKSARPRVLIHAVAGGVGTAAVQIGKILGIEIYGTSSSDEKLSRVRELGLQHGINYKQKDYVDAIKDLTHGEGVDAVFEMLGGEHVAKSVKCLRDFGRVIVYGAATGEIPSLDTRLLYAKGASVHGVWLSYLSANRPLMQSAWKQLSEWLAAGKLHPVIGKVYPLEEARTAYTLLQEGKNYGKIVLKIA